jgi:hypothetical protein
MSIDLRVAGRALDLTRGVAQSRTAAARERITAVMTRWHTQRSRSTSIACRERCRSVGAHATETTVQGVDVIAGNRDNRIDDRW